MKEVFVNYVNEFVSNKQTFTLIKDLNIYSC